MIGRALDHFRLLEQIGAGGMGDVYRAVDERTGEQVAVKVLRQHLRADPEHRARLRQEARTLAILGNRAVCAWRGSGRCAGVDYLAMEFATGRPLRAQMDGCPLPPAVVLGLGIPIGRALAAIHDHGVVHGDVKPENVLVSSSGRIKLLDFGLSRMVSHASGWTDARPAAGSSVPLSRAETISATWLHGRSPGGTLPYMSPEQARGEPIDPRSDLFSYGIVLYELATGLRPFSGRTWADILTSILRDIPVPPSALAGPGLAALDPIIDRCLRKEPTKRWQDADEVVAALEDAAETSAHDRRPAGRCTILGTSQSPCVGSRSVNP